MYKVLRLQVSADEERQVRMSGNLSPDVYLPDVPQDPPADPSTPLCDGVERHMVVVASGDTQWKGLATTEPTLSGMWQHTPTNSNLRNACKYGTSRDEAA